MPHRQDPQHPRATPLAGVPVPSVAPAAGAADDAAFRQWTAAVTEQLRDVSYAIEKLNTGLPERFEALEKAVADVRTTLSGNGHPENGLAFRVMMVQHMVADLQEWRQKQDKGQSTQSRIVTTVVSIVGLAAATAIWVGVKNLILKP